MSAECDLAAVLRRYGFLGFDLARAIRREDGSLAMPVATPAGAPTVTCVIAAGGSQAPAGLTTGGRYLYDGRRARWYRRRVPAYRALLPYRTFDDAGLEPVWIDEQGRTAVAWRRTATEHTLLVGLSVAEEIIRYTQGNPAEVESSAGRGRFGFDWEKPNYLYEAQVAKEFPTRPWADDIGFALAEWLAKAAGLPLVDPIPHARFGAVVLTGDDDQALLERYEMQLRLIDGFPITYYLHPLTQHTRETLDALPPSVEFGLHVDALDEPDRYGALCAEQSRQLRALCGRPARTIRNHGFLNRGYLGHLSSWEASGIQLDFNYPGVDGTALTGSFLPFQLRRRDGSWSDHLSLLTAFGDGMQEALKMTSAQAVACVRRVVKQIERGRPGVLVFNLHPQNVIKTAELHRAVVALGRRRGWTRLSAEHLLDWLMVFHGLQLRTDGAGTVLITSVAADGVAVRVPTRRGWERRAIPAWTGAYRLA